MLALLLLLEAQYFVHGLHKGWAHRVGRKLRMVRLFAAKHARSHQHAMPWVAGLIRPLDVCRRVVAHHEDAIEHMRGRGALRGRGLYRVVIGMQAAGNVQQLALGIAEGYGLRLAEVSRLQLVSGGHLEQVAQALCESPTRQARDPIPVSIWRQAHARQPNATPRSTT